MNSIVDLASEDPLEPKPEGVPDCPPEAALYERILSILERRTELEVLPALIHAIKSNQPTATLADSAIVIDANAVLRIPGHRKSSDIIDYLGAVHAKPVVLPGQVIQEFWNNQLSGVITVFKGVRNKFVELEKEASKAIESGISGMENIRSSLEDFKKDNEHLFDVDLVQKTSSFLETMNSKARVPHAPRVGLHEIASQRKLADPRGRLRTGRVVVVIRAPTPAQTRTESPILFAPRA